jgi:uncharacterized RDD family membrane protein YckC
MFLDRPLDLRRQNAELEGGVLISESSAHDRSEGKDAEGDGDEAQVAAKDDRIIQDEEAENRRRARFPGGIDDIVCPRQELIEVPREVHRAAIFAQGGEIGGDLPVEQPQFLEFAAMQAAQAAPLALVEQLLQPGPVRFAFFQPVSGDHAVSLEEQTQSQIPDAAGDRIAVDTPEQIVLEFPLAGVGSRFLAMALDTVLQALLYTAVIFTMVESSKYASLFPHWISWLPASWIPALLIFFMFSIYWGYFAVFEVLWSGKTPGKRAAGVRAIKDTGRALNVYEVIGRNLMRAVDWLPFFYLTGVITIMVSRKNQRLGDFLVGSIVVHEKRTEEIRPDFASARETKAAANPELSKITPEELVLIETYLQRRTGLDFAVRDATAYKIASRIKAKTGIERAPEQSLDDFLESIAKQLRDNARFR